ncbi:MAG: ABC transporter substrate-binding protein [Microthrixaceae bacterium]
MRAARRGPRVVGALVIALATLAACTGGGNPEPDTTGAVVDGGTLRLGLEGPIEPDPAASSLGSPTDLMVLDLLYDGLTALDARGLATPALASKWTPNKTLTSWTFTLDPDAERSDGRPVTAALVIASLERVAKGGDSSLAALRLESIKGFRAFVDGTADRLSGLSAPSATSVRIDLDAPLSVLPTVLASPVYGVVDAASLTAAAAPGGDLNDLVLSGGWEVRSAKRSVLTLGRLGGTVGHLDSVELRSYRDASGAYDAFDKGRVDWALVPVERYDQAVEAHGDAAFSPFHAELYFGMRLTTPGLDKLELRQAIVAAIDRSAIVRAVYADLADPLTTIVPEGVPGRDSDRCTSCAHDVARAKALVAKAYPDGKVPTIPIDFDQSPAQAAMAGLVSKQLRAVGIPTTLRPKPLADYKRFVVSGQQALFSFGWIGGYASADAYLAPLFGSVANDNLTGYGVDSVDAALAAARATTSAATQAKQWADVERRVLTDAPVVPIAQFRIQAILGDRVKGFAHRVDGSVDWSQISLTPDS